MHSMKLNDLKKGEENVAENTVLIVAAICHFDLIN